MIYLLDEVLSGTNSSDRRIGTSLLMEQLFQSGSIGMVTTHDRSLLNLVSYLGDAVSIFHFRSDVSEHGIECDYIMRPGALPSTNGFELMKFLGLVPKECS